MKSMLAKYFICIPLVLTIVFSISDLTEYMDTQFWGTIVLRNILVYACGWQMIGFAVGHLLFGNRVAEYIGWTKDDPFQFEVGLADLGMGILGVMCSSFDGSFWLAPIVMVTIFGWGCAVGHIRHMVKNKNFKPGNAGYPFFWDVLLPIALIVFGFIHLRYTTG